MNEKEQWFFIRFVAFVVASSIYFIDEFLIPITYTTNVVFSIVGIPLAIACLLTNYIQNRLTGIIILGLGVYNLLVTNCNSAFYVIFVEFVIYLICVMVMTCLLIKTR